MILNDKSINSVEKLHNEIDPLIKKYRKSLGSETSLFDSDEKKRFDDFEKIYYSNYDSYENLVILLEETSKNGTLLNKIGIRSISFDDYDRRYEKFFDGGRRYETRNTVGKFVEKHAKQAKKDRKELALQSISFSELFASGFSLSVLIVFLFIGIGLLLLFYTYIREMINQIIVFKNLVSSNTINLFQFLFYLAFCIALIIVGIRCIKKYFKQYIRSVFNEGKYLKSFLAFGTVLLMLFGILCLFLLFGEIGNVVNSTGLTKNTILQNSPIRGLVVLLFGGSIYTFLVTGIPYLVASIGTIIVAIFRKLIKRN